MLRPAAALIVVGGTCGAVLVSFPLRNVGEAFGAVLRLLMGRTPEGGDIVDEIVAFAGRARRDGFLALEKSLRLASDPLLRQGLSLVVDGHDARTVRSVLELKLRGLDERLERAPAVLEAAGGYAPTLGILGAVLGLIQVLHHFEGTADVGSGIATAFVATLYGVGLANLVLLPLATKLRVHYREDLLRKALIVEGVVSIQEGATPHLIADKLRAFREDEGAEAA